MYAENQVMQAGRGTLAGCDVVDRNPTVRENIDTKIGILKAEIERLEKSKGTLGPILDIRIRDLREATSF